MNRSCIAAVLALSVTSLAHGAVMSKYDFTGNAGNENSKAPTFSAVNTSNADITRGAGVDPQPASNAFNSSKWNGNSLTTNDYYEFSSAPAPGAKLNLDTLIIAMQRSGSGPTNFAIRSSLDSFAANIYSTTSSSTSAIELSVPLSSSFDNLSSGVTFRLYGWNASNANGTLRLLNHSVQQGLAVDGNSGPTATLASSSVSVDVSPAGLESFSAIAVNAQDNIGITSASLGTIPPQIADNIVLSGSGSGPYSVSGSNFTYADVGTFTIPVTVSDGEFSYTTNLNLTVTPEPGTLLGLTAFGLLAMRRRA